MSGETKLAKRETKTALIDDQSLQAVMELDSVLAKSQSQLAECDRNGQKMLKAIVMARSMNQIRTMMSDAIMADVMSLMNTPLGFKTDRKPPSKSYSVDEVRDVAIIAMIDGGQFVGNDFNIIAGQYYRTKEQLERRVQTWPGLSNLHIQLDVPVNANGGALVGGKATWRMDGKPCQLEFRSSDNGDQRIPIRVNEGMGVDAVLGKATRKALKRIWDVLQGYEADDFDPDDKPATNAAAIVEASPSRSQQSYVEFVQALDKCIDLTALENCGKDYFGTMPSEDFNQAIEARRAAIKGGRGAGSKPQGASV